MNFYVTNIIKNKYSKNYIEALNNNKIISMYVVFLLFIENQSLDSIKQKLKEFKFLDEKNIDSIIYSCYKNPIPQASYYIGELIFRESEINKTKEKVIEIFLEKNIFFLKYNHFLY